MSFIWHLSGHWNAIKLRLSQKLNYVFKRAAACARVTTLSSICFFSCSLAGVFHSRLQSWESEVSLCCMWAGQWESWSEPHHVTVVLLVHSEEKHRWTTQVAHSLWTHSPKVCQCVCVCVTLSLSNALKNKLMKHEQEFTTTLSFLQYHLHTVCLMKYICRRKLEYRLLYKTLEQTGSHSLMTWIKNKEKKHKEWNICRKASFKPVQHLWCTCAGGWSRCKRHTIENNDLNLLRLVGL